MQSLVDWSGQLGFWVVLLSLWLPNTMEKVLVLPDADHEYTITFFEDCFLSCLDLHMIAIDC